jgi:hypothetical protein
MASWSLHAKLNFIVRGDRRPGQREALQRNDSSVKIPLQQKAAVPKGLRIKGSSFGKIVLAGVFPQNRKSCNTSVAPLNPASVLLQDR